MDPITDIFRTMHVPLSVCHRLEATAPWGVYRRSRPRQSPFRQKDAPTDLAHFAMLRAGNCWLSVEGIPEPIPPPVVIAFCWPGDFDCFARQPANTSEVEFPRDRGQGQRNVAHCGGGGAPTDNRLWSLSFDRAA